MTTRSEDSTLLFLDEHAGHAHDHGDVEKEVELENVIFENINQTAIEVNGATVHHADDVTSKDPSLLFL